MQHIRAVNANAKTCRAHWRAGGQALLFITRIGYLDEGPPVELTHSYCHSDYYDFVAEMRRNP